MKNNSPFYSIGILTCILIVFMYSCSNKEQQTHSIRKIFSKTIYDDDNINSDILIGNTHLFCCVDSFLFLRDLYGNKCFTMINLKENKVSRICPVGQGPGEIINPSHLTSIVNISDTTLLAVFDMGYSKVFFYNLENLLTDDNTKGSKNLSINRMSNSNVDGWALSLLSLNDSLWIGEGFYENGVLSFYKNGVKQNSVLDFYFKDDSEGKYLQTTKDANIFRLSHNKSHLVRGTQHAGFIETYSIEEEKLTNLFSHNLFDVNHKETDRYGFIDVCVSNRYTYGLYSGKLKEENSSFESQQIYVFDNNTGNVVEILQTDVPIMAIDLDMNGNVIYAITSDNFATDNKVVAFALD